MALSVVISSPSGNTPVPCTVSGTATPSAGNTLGGMGWSINGGSAQGVITNFPPGGGQWSFTLPASACPQQGQDYTLEVTAGEMPGGDFTSDSDSIIPTN
jgi:hypothetical protein